MNLRLRIQRFVRRLMIFLWLISASLPSAAALLTDVPTQYSCRVWQADDGIPQNCVQAVAQTRDGYLWLGTPQGLLRFDGDRFEPVSEAVFPGGRKVSVTALQASADGTLWVATERDGLKQLKNGNVVSYTQEQGLASNGGLRDLRESRDGALWIATTNGLSCLRNGQFDTYTKDGGLSSSVVRSIDEDAEGNIWAATAIGVDCLSAGKVKRRINLESGLPGLMTRVVLCDSRSNVWIGVVGGLARVSNGTITTFSRTNGLADDTLTSLYEDRQGTIWIGTYGGLYRYSGGKIQQELNNEGQQFDMINSIAEDREGNLWIAARDGLVRLTPKRFVSFTRREGLAHNNVISLCQDKSGTLWIGTWGGGINQLRDGVITSIETRDRVVNHKASIDLVLALCEDRKRQMWIGTDFNGGLYQHRNGKFTRFSAKEGLNQSAVRVVFEDSRTNLWVGSSDGLFIFKEGRFRRFGGPEGLIGLVVRAIVEDKDGHLWVGTEDRGGPMAALHCLREGKFTVYRTENGLSSSSIMALHFDAEGTLWIGTRDGGLNRLKNGKFTAYTTARGLSTDEIFEIVEDNLGCVWLTSRIGIMHVKKSDFDDLDQGRIATLDCHLFGRADGLASVECAGIGRPTACKTTDGRLWFGTSKGLVMTDPAVDHKGNAVAPPVFVTSVTVNGQVIPRNENFQVPPGPGELNIRYTALSFQAPEKNRFKYKLEGLDANWIDAGSRREAYYNNVPPGSYRFHVVGCNNDGVWNQKGDFVTFTLQPRFWETWWFHTLVALAVLGTVGGISRYVSVRKLKGRVEKLEREHAIEQERARIAQDMHDDLGARLTEIMLLSDVAERSAAEPAMKKPVTRIAQASRELVQNLDAIVWAVNPRNDSLNNLAIYIYEFLERFFAPTSIHCRLDVPDELPQWPLSSEVRHNLFLVVKETLNNIVKHSGGSEVWFRLRFENGVLDISIHDNGKGFQMADVSVTGNGLINMQRRIEKIGGTYCIGSEPGVGTETQIRLRLAEKG